MTERPIISRRRLFAAAGALVAVAGGARSSWAAASDPTATLKAFYDVLLATMKQGPELGFAGRRDKLAPAVRQAFDMPLMTRLVVGLEWQKLSSAEQQQLIAAFTDFSVANYASQFDNWSGERFVVEPQATPAPSNDVMVHTQLDQTNDKPVELDYLLRDVQSDWRIIDVYLSGTISQLAVRRSEFSAVLRQQGAQGLIALLKQKTAQLATG